MIAHHRFMLSARSHPAFRPFFRAMFDSDMIQFRNAEDLILSCWPVDARAALVFSFQQNRRRPHTHHRASGSMLWTLLWPYVMTVAIYHPIKGDLSSRWSPTRTYRCKVHQNCRLTITKCIFFPNLLWYFFGMALNTDDADCDGKVKFFWCPPWYCLLCITWYSWHQLQIVRPSNPYLECYPMLHPVSLKH